MLKIIYSWFTAPDLDQVLSGFTKLERRLESFLVAHAKIQEVHLTQAQLHKELHDASVNDTKLATAVLENVRVLCSL